MVVLHTPLTFRVISVSDIARIRPGKFGMNYGVYVTGEVTGGDLKGQTMTFIAPLGNCDPADPTFRCYCRYWQGHYDVNVGDILDGTPDGEVVSTGNAIYLLNSIRFNESYVNSLQ